MTATVRWELSTGSSSGGVPQPDPNLSISGKRSTTRVEEIQSTLTSVSATPRSVFDDSSQITGAGFPPPAPSGDPRALTGDSGAYTESSDLIHWWRMTFDPNDDKGGGDRGGDYGLSPLDLDTFALTLPSGSQIIAAPANAPVQMYQQRSCYPFTGSFRQASRSDQVFGFDGNVLTVAAWIYPTSGVGSGLASGATVFAKGNQFQSANGSLTTANCVWLTIADLNNNNASRVQFAWSDDANLSGQFISTNTVTLNAWNHIVGRYNLATQSADIFINGVKEVAYVTSNFPASMVRSVVGAANNDAVVGATRNGDARRFAGNVHSVATWKAFLSDAAIATVAAMGDGPELPAPPIIDYTGDLISFHDAGTNRDQVRLVEIFDDSIGRFTLQADLPADAAPGDTYRIWPANGLFSPFSNDQSVRRAQKSRLVNINTPSVQLSNYRLWVVPLDPGPLVCEVAQGSRTGAELTVGAMPDEETDPTLTYFSPAFFNQGLTVIDRFQRANGPAAAEFESPLGTGQLNAGQFRPIFIRLRFREGEPLPLFHRCIFQIFGGTSDGVTVGSMVVHVDVLGADEELILGPDRALRLKAGARVQALIRDAATGTPVPNKTVTISQTAGPGTLGPQSSEVSDDSGNPVRATYLSPTDEVEVGEDVTFEVEVN